MQEKQSRTLAINNTFKMIQLLQISDGDAANKCKKINNLKIFP